MEYLLSCNHDLMYTYNILCITGKFAYSRRKMVGGYCDYLLILGGPICCHHDNVTSSQGPERGRGKYLSILVNNNEKQKKRRYLFVKILTYVVIIIIVIIFIIIIFSTIDIYLLIHSFIHKHTWCTVDTVVPIKLYLLEKEIGLVLISPQEFHASFVEHFF